MSGDERPGRGVKSASAASSMFAVLNEQFGKEHECSGMLSVVVRTLLVTDRGRNACT